MCEKLLIAWSSPSTQEVRCGGISSTSLVLTRLYSTIAVVCGLPAGFWSSVENSRRMVHLVEQDGDVADVFWPIPFVYEVQALAASPPVADVTE